MDRATKAQLQYISEMRNFVSEKFDGELYHEASNYIFRNVCIYHLCATPIPHYKED